VRKVEPLDNVVTPFETERLVTALPAPLNATLVITGPLDAVNVPFVAKLTPVIACPADAAEPPPGRVERKVDPLVAVITPLEDTDTSVMALPPPVVLPLRLVRTVPLDKVATPFETDTSVITLPVDDVVTLVITAPLVAVNAPFEAMLTPVIAEPALAAMLVEGTLPVIVTFPAESAARLTIPEPET
jgi:hypothetical protein